MTDVARTSLRRPVAGEISGSLRDRLNDADVVDTGATLAALQAELRELAHQREPERKVGRRRVR